MQKILLLILALMISAATYAQNLQDVIYLKNGSVIRGTLIEQVPNVKIRTYDGSIWVFEDDKIERIAQEPYDGNRGVSEAEVPASGFTSTDSRKAEQRNIFFNGQLHKGMRMMVGFMYQQKLDEYSCSAMDVDLSIGWQLSPKVFAGFGLADQIYMDYWFYGFKSTSAEPVAQVPFFVDLRYDHKPGKFSPFADFRFGYSFTSDEYVNYSGMYLNPSVGIRYHRFSFSVGMEAVKLEEPMMVISYTNGYTTLNETEIYWQGALQFRLIYEWGGRR